MQNQGNKQKQRSQTTSKYKGVSWHKASKKWRACISHNDKHKHIGTFEIELAAAIAYNDAAIKYFGDFALLNDLNPKLQEK